MRPIACPPARLLADPQVAAAVSVVYMALDIYADDAGNAAPSMAELVAATGGRMAPKTIRRYLGDLELGRYITVMERRGDVEPARYHLPGAPTPDERAEAETRRASR
jgi:hypothetical protein